MTQLIHTDAGNFSIEAVQEMYNMGCITESEYTALMPVKTESHSVEDIYMLGLFAQEEMNDVPEDKTTIVFKLNQRGIDTANLKAGESLLSNDIVSQVEITGDNVDGSAIAGKIATDLFISLQSLPSRGLGYYLQFYVNEVQQDINYKWAGRLNFNNEIDLTFCVMNILISRFNSDSKGTITGNIAQGDVVKGMLTDIGMTNTNLGLTHAMFAMDIARKQRKQESRLIKRQILVDAHGEEWVLAKEAKAKDQREAAKKKAAQDAHQAEIKRKQKAALRKKHGKN